MTTQASNGQNSAPTVFPLEIGPSRTLKTQGDVADLIIEETNRQVAEQHPTDDDIVGDPDDVVEFQMACDALNWWRLRWRSSEETGTAGLEDVYLAIARTVATKREYTWDEFELAIHATRGRARSPFGLSPLQVAVSRAERYPIRLRAANLRNSVLPTAIASIAFHLQGLRPDSHILLPVESLRSMLKQRKLVVSGAIRLLMFDGLLQEVGNGYHTGRAREFRFTGKDGVDYDYDHGNTIEMS